MTRIPDWYRYVLLFFLGWVFLYGDRTILAPALEDIGREWSLSASQLGLISSMFFLTYTAFQLPSAFLADRHGRKRVLVPGYLFFALTTALMGVAPSYGVLLLWSALGGIGQSTYYASQYSLSSQAIPAQHLGLGSAMINSGMAVGSSVGLLVASGLVEVLGTSWRAPFLVMAVPTAFVGLLIARFIPEAPRREAPRRESPRREAPRREAPTEVKTERETGARAASSDGTPVGKPYTVHVLKRPALLWLCAANFCSLYGFFLILTWLPYYLQNVRAMTTVQSGVVSSIVLWVSIPSALILSTLSDRLFSRRWTMVTLLGIAALAMVMIPYVESGASLIALLVLYGIVGKLTVDPIMVAFVAQAVPDDVSAGAFGVLNFAGMIGSVLAPVITGAIVDATGQFSAAFLIGGILLAFGMLSVLATFRAVPPTSETMRLGAGAER